MQFVNGDFSVGDRGVYILQYVYLLLLHNKTRHFIYIISKSIYLNVLETSPGVTYIINTVLGYQCPLQKSFKHPGPPPPPPPPPQPSSPQHLPARRGNMEYARPGNSINITTTIPYTYKYIHYISTTTIP